MQMMFWNDFYLSMIRWNMINHFCNFQMSFFTNGVPNDILNDILNNVPNDKIVHLYNTCLFFISTIFNMNSKHLILLKYCILLPKVSWKRIQE